MDKEILLEVRESMKDNLRKTHSTAEKITWYLSQLAPHASDREAATLLREAALEIQALDLRIQDAKACLVCSVIGDPAEVCKTTFDILEGGV